MLQTSREPPEKPYQGSFQGLGPCLPDEALALSVLPEEDTARTKVRRRGRYKNKKMDANSNQIEKPQEDCGTTAVIVRKVKSRSRRGRPHSRKKNVSEQKDGLVVESCASGAGVIDSGHTTENIELRDIPTGTHGLQEETGCMVSSTEQCLPDSSKSSGCTADNSEQGDASECMNFSGKENNFVQGLFTTVKEKGTSEINLDEKDPTLPPNLHSISESESNVQSASCRIQDIPEMNLSDFTIQFEDEQPKPRKRGRQGKGCVSVTEVEESPNIPEILLSDLSIQFDDEQPKTESNNEVQKEKCPPKKKRRRSRMSTDIDVANVIASPAIDSTDVQLPLPSMRRSKRIRRKSVELYRRSFKAAEESSDSSVIGLLDESEKLAGLRTTSSEEIPNELCTETPKTPELSHIVFKHSGNDHSVSSNGNNSNANQLTSDQASCVYSDESSTNGNTVTSKHSSDLSPGTGLLRGGDTIADKSSTNAITSVQEEGSSSKVSADSDVQKNKRPVRARAQRVVYFPASPDTPETPSPQVKKGRRKSKGKHKESEKEIEELYRNKNFKMPETKSWETIFESPLRGDQIGKRKLKRSLLFEDDPNMHLKYKRRRKKAVKNGWKPLSKAKLEKAEKKLYEKLKVFEEELNLLEENIEDCGECLCSNSRSTSVSCSTLATSQPAPHSSIGGLDNTGLSSDSCDTESVTARPKNDSTSCSIPLQMPTSTSSPNNSHSPGGQQTLSSVPEDGESNSVQKLGDKDDISCAPASIKELCEYSEEDRVITASSIKIEVSPQQGGEAFDPCPVQEDNHTIPEPISASSFSSESEEAPKYNTNNSCSFPTVLGSPISPGEKAEANVNAPGTLDSNLPIDNDTNGVTDISGASTDKLEDGCCVWKEKTCDWSTLSSSSHGGADNAVCMEEDESLPGSRNGSRDSDLKEDERLQFISEPEETSPEVSDTLSSDIGAVPDTGEMQQRRSTSSSTLPLDASGQATTNTDCSRTVTDASEANSTNLDLPNSVSKDSNSSKDTIEANAKSSASARLSQCDDELAQSYWEKISIFQNIFS